VVHFGHISAPSVCGEQKPEFHLCFYKSVDNIELSGKLIYRTIIVVGGIKPVTSHFTRAIFTNYF